MAMSSETLRIRHERNQRVRFGFIADEPSVSRDRFIDHEINFLVEMGADRDAAQAVMNAYVRRGDEAYHGVSHLRNLIAAATVTGSLSVELHVAILFHDCVMDYALRPYEATQERFTLQYKLGYSLTPLNEVRSANVCRHVMRAMRNIEHVARAIEATAWGPRPNESLAHSHDLGDVLSHKLVTLDRRGLDSDDWDYLIYVEKALKVEYAQHVPVHDYMAGRVAFLRACPRYGYGNVKLQTIAFLLSAV